MTHHHIPMADYATKYNISPQRVYWHVKNGNIPSIKHGRLRMIDQRIKPPLRRTISYDMMESIVRLKQNNTIPKIASTLNISVATINRILKIDKELS